MSPEEELVEKKKGNLLTRAGFGFEFSPLGAGLSDVGAGLFDCARYIHVIYT